MRASRCDVSDSVDVHDKANKEIEGKPEIRIQLRNALAFLQRGAYEVIEYRIGCQGSRCEFRMELSTHIERMI